MPETFLTNITARHSMSMDLYRQSGGLPKHAGCCHYAIGQLPEPVREGSKP